MKKYYQLIKNIHFYLSLFVSPFIIVFALSALVLNHNFAEWQEDWWNWHFSADDQVDRTVAFHIPSRELSHLDFATNIRDQIGISGEIANVHWDSMKVYIPVTKPGYRISIKADLASGVAYIHSQQTTMWKKLVWLHKMPGPHNANIRGNWNFTEYWGLLADFAVMCLYLSSITGIILWYNFKNERTVGLIAIIVGFLSIASLIIGLTI